MFFKVQANASDKRYTYTNDVASYSVSLCTSEYIFLVVPDFSVPSRNLCYTIVPVCL